MSLQPHDLVRHTHVSRRDAATPIVTRTLGRVVSIHEDVGLAVFVPLRRFVYVEGYFEKGRQIPVGAWHSYSTGWHDAPPGAEAIDELVKVMP